MSSMTLVTAYQKDVTVREKNVTASANAKSVIQHHRNLNVLAEEIALAVAHTRIRLDKTYGGV